MNRTAVLLNLMHQSLSAYRRYPHIPEFTRESSENKVHAVKRMVSAKQLDALSRELLPWLRCMLGKRSRRSFIPSQDHWPLVQAIMKKGMPYCFSLVLLVAEHPWQPRSR